MNWAWEHSKAHSGTLLVMLALADSANVEHGDSCWPGQELLARMTRLTRRQVTRAVKQLALLGEIEIVRTKAGNTYRLLMPISTNGTICPEDTHVSRDGTLMSSPDETPTSSPRVEDEVELEKNPNTGRATAVHEIWDFYEQTIPSRRSLNEKRRRQIENALKVRSVDEIKRAIVGLSRSPWHVDGKAKGWLDIRYALKGKGDESDDDRIDKAIEWGILYDPVYTNVSPVKVERWLEALRYATQTHTEIDEGKRALENLRGAGFKVVRVEPAGPPWVRISR